MHNFVSSLIFAAIPIITLQPVGTTVHTGTDYVDMNCSAVGHSTIMYHWEKYNANYSEWSSLPTNQQTDINKTSTYRLRMLTKSDDGMYRCVATNIDGSGYSQRVTITVYGMSSYNNKLLNVIHTYDVTHSYTANMQIHQPSSYLQPKLILWKAKMLH